MDGSPGHPGLDLTWHILDIHVDGETPEPKTLDPRRGCFIVFWRNEFPFASRSVSPGLLDAGALRPPEVVRIAPSPPPKGKPTVARHLSVVIPTRDRPADLTRCLASFAGQTVRPAEIVVVDNASRMGETRDAALAAGAIYVREDRPGLDIARNAGVTAARGELIAFCDDDVVLHRDWCRQIVLAFADPTVSAVTGLVLPAELDTEAQREFEFHWGFGRGFEAIDFGPEFMCSTRNRGCPVWQVGAGASMAFRRSVFAKVGLFDERLDAGAAGCSGDSEMWYRILAEGGTCRYQPLIVSHHAHRRSTEALRTQLTAYMRGHLMALLVQFQRYRHLGNLYRAFFALPAFYASRLAGRVLRGRKDEFLADEVRGYLQGFWYFLAHRRLSTPRLPLQPVRKT